MDESDFEGTEVLEQLAVIDKVDDFFEAIDSDNLGKAESLMRKAQVDPATIQSILQKIQEASAQ